MEAVERDMMQYMRDAELRDVSRLAEILVFSKRTHYRSIFHDDAFSFGDLQVYPLAQDLLSDPEKLTGYRVYDDGFVKGLVHTKEDQIAEFYVDPFFERQHIGCVMMQDALSRILHPSLWVLEKNLQAVGFYQKNGFEFTGERMRMPGTSVYQARMKHREPVDDVIGKLVRVTVDRPLGSSHPRYADMIYPVNYGYIEGVSAGDGEWQDAYILGVDHPLSEFAGRVTAVIHREDDREDKWAVVPDTVDLSDEEILRLVSFQEKFFRIRIIR